MQTLPKMKTDMNYYGDSPNPQNYLPNMETDRTLLTKANVDTDENENINSKEQIEQQIINEYLGKQEAIIGSMGPYDQESNAFPK